MKIQWEFIENIYQNYHFIFKYLQNNILHIDLVVFIIAKYWGETCILSNRGLFK